MAASPDPRAARDPYDDTDLDRARRVIEPDVVHAHQRESEVGDQFNVTLRGYDRHQVDAYLRTWGEDYWATRNERDALLAEVEHLRAAPPTQLSPLASMSVRVQEIVAAAEEEAAALRHETRERADALLEEAREQAEADLTAAAQERTLARGEAERLTTEARETHDRLITEAQALADRTVVGAQDEAAQLLAAARAETEELRRVVGEEQELLLSAARAEAAELARATARQREMAEAEHQRLLTAHASQQRHFSENLRREIAKLQAEVERLTTDVERRRTQVIAAATPPSTPPPTATSALLTDQDVAAAALDEIHALGEDSGEIAPFDSFLHTGDTGEVPVDPPTEVVEPAPAGKGAIDALRRTDRASAEVSDSYADDALDLVARSNDERND